jgi:hypothetical protein
MTEEEDGWRPDLGTPNRGCKMHLVPLGGEIAGDAHGRRGGARP